MDIEPTYTCTPSLNSSRYHQTTNISTIIDCLHCINQTFPPGTDTTVLYTLLPILLEAARLSHMSQRLPTIKHLLITSTLHTYLQHHMRYYQCITYPATHLLPTPCVRCGKSAISHMFTQPTVRNWKDRSSYQNSQTDRHGENTVPVPPSVRSHRTN